MHIIYDGPSLLNGEDIIVLATGYKRPSQNRKTGPMIQTFILHKHTPPTVAVKNHDDEAVCGNCPHRSGSCYVLTHQAPSAVYKAYKNSNLALSTKLSALGRNRAIRIGSYGDPAAVPTEIWAQFTKYANFSTGYTHAWQTCDEQLKSLCMASVDSIEEQRIAQSRGWKTFRVMPLHEDITNNEALCQFEANGAQCYTCRLCDGRRTNVAVHVHGAKHKIIQFHAHTTRKAA